MENSVSVEAQTRKERSEAVLKAAGVPINMTLPVIESSTEAKLREKEEIAYRALSLLVVAVKAEGLEQKIVEKIIKDYGLISHLTPNERDFIENMNPKQHDKVQFVWRYEAAWTLLWALGYVENFTKPENICDVPAAVKIMRDRTTAQFISQSKLRTADEVLDQADLIYRYNWAVVDARINGKETPAGLEPGVVLERHYALNWLVSYMGQQWDDVSTDT